MTIILQHESDTTPGTTTTWLERNQMPYRICKLYENESLPEQSDFENLIICGGSMNVNEEEKFLWMKAEKALIKDALHLKKKVLGLCLGAQMMAEVLGAKVGKMRYAEVGWHDVDVAAHPLTGNEAVSLPVFQWHSYCFSAVPNATHLASNEACLNQAFALGSNTIGFQFHPETTIEWMNECANDTKIPQGQFCQNPNEIRDQFEKQKEMQTWYFKVLNRFF